MRALPPLPESFVFGVATADHQCEAYAGQDDERDVWERERTITPRGRATDFWNRYAEDVALARSLGCKIFRISLSWARLAPQRGSWDAQAAAHYREVLQCIRDAGMKTVVTLHHNTWPVYVQADGGGAGMLDADFPNRFAEYAGRAASELGDLIDYYITINEPSELIFGYIKGWWMRAYRMPPGLGPFVNEEQQMAKVLELIPALFLAHKRGRDAIRAVRPNAMVGSNPLVFGWPRFVRSFVDWQATRVKRPGDVVKQAKYLSRASALGKGRVDITLAQLTMTPDRKDLVLFSDPYFTAHLCALHSKDVPLPADFAAWCGRIGVTVETAPADEAAHLFPSATLSAYRDTATTVAALRSGDVDIVVDDDAMLQRFVAGNLELTRISALEQRFAVAMSLGKRALLDAVNAALRDTDAAAEPAITPGTHHDDSLAAIRRRGLLRVGVQPGVPGLCVVNAGRYEGLEPDLARRIAARILDTPNPTVRFVPVSGNERLRGTHSLWSVFDPLRKMISILSTIACADWWNLGMAGKLPHFLCPKECVGSLDFVGLDYYWGVSSLWPWVWRGIAASMDFRYGNAPVWPDGLYNVLEREHRHFPGMPILVIENGCVARASGVPRADYVAMHVRQVQRAVAHGIPVEAYLCWSITSNREWGLPFNDDSDFGLYHIELDTDPELKRTPTEASERYANIVAARSVS